MAKKSTASLFNSGTGEKLVAALSETLKAKKVLTKDDSYSLSGYVKLGNSNTVLFTVGDTHGDWVEIPVNMIENATWGKTYDGFTAATLRLKTSTPDAKLAFGMLRQLVSAISRRVKTKTTPKAKTTAALPLSESTSFSGSPCHMCGCTGWYDSNDNGLCNGTNWDDPDNYCGHPIISHY